MDLLKNYRIIRYDVRGHGESNAPRMDYSLEMLADDLFGLIDALEIDQLHYISLSMGGMIGQTAALKDQNRFLSLSLCDTSSRMLPEIQGAWDERSATARADRIRTLLDGTMERWFSSNFIENKPEECDKVRDMIRNTRISGYCGCCRAIEGLNLTDRLHAITVPT